MSLLVTLAVLVVLLPTLTRGDYPGVPFPWSTECPQGYDFCGVLEFCMTTNDEDITSYGYRVPCPDGHTCQCTFPGPLIRLVTGNVYKLRLRNAGTEITNLHTHGLHIVGSGNGDDVTRLVTGGHCLDYEWNIPEDHPGGTYWYHAHHHGATEDQVGGGAFGMLIVQDNTRLNDPATLPSWAENERLLQISLFDPTYEMYANGKKDEVIDIAAYQWYRLRISMVSANAVPYDLTFDDQGMCDIHRVASDGIWHSVVPGPSSNVWELTGASRADFAIRCNTEEAYFPIYYRDPNEPVAHIWVGTWEESPYEEMKEWKPNRPYALYDLSKETVPEANKFAVKLGYDDVNDGEQWDPSTPLTTIPYDQVHEWTLIATNQHPFHLHLYHFQVVTPGGCGDAHKEGEFYDTISAPDDCTVRFRTADIGQMCVLHCHVLFHEDNGSMSWVDVTGPNMPTNTKQSYEYACPSPPAPPNVAETPAPSPAPTKALTPSPTKAPTQTQNSCVPGYLGIATGQPMLSEGKAFVNEAYGVYIRQQKDGNLVIRRGTPENSGDKVWASGAVVPSGPHFYSQIQDAHLVTYVGTPDKAADSYILWPSNWQTSTYANDGTEYFLGIDCKSKIVSVYAGSWEKPESGVPITVYGTN